MKQTRHNVVSVFITVHVDKHRHMLYTSFFRLGMGHSFKSDNFIKSSRDFDKTIQLTVEKSGEKKKTETKQ